MPGLTLLFVMPGLTLLFIMPGLTLLFVMPGLTLLFVMPGLTRHPVEYSVAHIACPREDALPGTGLKCVP